MKRIGLIFVLAAVGAVAQQKPDLAQQALRKAQEARLQADLENMRQTYSESHPDILRLKAQLDQLQRQQALLTLGGLETGRPDKWWNNPAAAGLAGLTPDQQKKMDDVFQQYRLKLIDLNAALEKEEVTLEPLVAAGQLDEAKISAQIDRVAQARAELEKANGRMLLGIRKLLTQDQWNKLQRGSQ